MPPDCFRRDTCRLCESGRLAEIMSLAPTPPANQFVDDAGRGDSQPVFPLDLFMCEACGHVQLRDVVDPALLFENYVYVSGTSPLFVNHFDDYAAGVIAKLGLDGDDLVVDIGSNDGTLLKAFARQGIETLGIDPAREIARRATAAGVETIPEFFSPGLAARIRSERGAAAVVTANNVLAHSDGLADILEGVRGLLSPDGVFVFEVSYLLDLFEQTLFDMIYHEHLAYHSVKPLRSFFAAHGMTLFDVARIGTHGGSIRGFAQLAGGGRPTSDAVGSLVAREVDRGLDRPATFRTWAERIDERGRELLTVLRKERAAGKSIAGFGAPAKATTLMFHFGIGPETLEFIVDESPFKQGLYTPGLHVPVLPPTALAERKPDCLLVLAWNFADSIIDRYRSFIDDGGRFIVPLPRLRVVER